MIEATRNLSRKANVNSNVHQGKQDRAQDSWAYEEQMLDSKKFSLSLCKMYICKLDLTSFKQLRKLYQIYHFIWPFKFFPCMGNGSSLTYDRFFA